MEIDSPISVLVEEEEEQIIAYAPDLEIYARDKKQEVRGLYHNIAN